MWHVPLRDEVREIRGVAGVGLPLQEVAVGVSADGFVERLRGFPNAERDIFEVRPGVNSISGGIFVVWFAFPQYFGISELGGGSGADGAGTTVC